VDTTVWSNGKLKSFSKVLLWWNSSLCCVVTDPTLPSYGRIKLGKTSTARTSWYMLYSTLTCFRERYQHQSYICKRVDPVPEAPTWVGSGEGKNRGKPSPRKICGEVLNLVWMMHRTWVPHIYMSMHITVSRIAIKIYQNLFSDSHGHRHWSNVIIKERRETFF